MGAREVRITLRTTIVRFRFRLRTIAFRILAGDHAVITGASFARFAARRDRRAVRYFRALVHTTQTTTRRRIDQWTRTTETTLYINALCRRMTGVLMRFAFVYIYRNKTKDKT